MPAIYVHIPFCLSKCYYCDFVSAVHEGNLAERYTAALEQEAALRAAELRELQHPTANNLTASPTVNGLAASNTAGLSSIPAHSGVNEAPPAGPATTPPADPSAAKESAHQPGTNPSAAREPAAPTAEASQHWLLAPTAEAFQHWLSAPTVFFGGGTPTTLTVDQLGRILAAVRSHFGIRPGAEVTIEANPRTHVFESTGNLAALREQGVNRLSLGVQSFDDHLLKLIGRDHGAAQAEAAVARARAEGFDNLSIDLIFALPGQTLRQWQATLDRALQLGTEHISLYGLTIEEGTVFGEQHRRGELDPAPSDLEADMYDLAIRTLTAAGFEHYEVSNFARPGRRSAHNQVYWRMEDYLGLGVGAHSCIRSVRFANGRNTAQHVRTIESGQLPTASREELSPREALGEAMWLGLRLLDGLDLDRVAHQFGESPARAFHAEIEALLRRGLLQQHGSHLSLTREGLFLGNEVFCQFA